VKSQFLIDKLELHPGLIIFLRGGVKHHNWYCRIKIPKEDRYKTISLKTADIDEAKKKATRHSYDIETRIQHQVPVFEKTFAEVANEYHDFQKLLALAKDITMSRWKIVGSYIRLHLLPFMNNTQITQVGDKEWKTYPLWRKNEGGNLIVKKGKKGAPDEKTIVPAKDGAIRQEMMTFRAIMNFAADKQYIRERCRAATCLPVRLGVRNSRRKNTSNSIPSVESGSREQRGRVRRASGIGRWPTLSCS